MAERQKIIESNRSLRLIKNELESLLEKGVIGDDVFDSISRLLPAESSLSSAGTPATRTAGFPTPASTASATPASPQPPAAGFANLNMNSNSSSHEPPSYTQSTGTPSVQAQAQAAPPPPPPPPAGKPVIAHARALYKYAASDARDCSFERDDRIAVHEYMNADWWMGRNLRTGSEGIFPKNYVELDVAPPPGPPPPQMTPAGYPVDEKAGYNGYQPPGQPQYGGYPPPPGQQNPYNSSVPPMAVAEQGSGSGQGGDGKVGEYGKKFGKKLGNAAIFGAGATIGGNIVNSIF